jgi:Protein of unknown function (DUF3037)
MPELKKFEYFFLRYAPYPNMDDYVSFGLVVLEHAPNGFAGVRFMKNWRRLLCSHPDTDLDYFHFLEQEMSQRLASGVQRDELLARMYDSLGNTVQLSQPRECLAETPQAALDMLARGSIDIPLAASKPEPRERRRILVRIEDAFDRAGIWARMTKNSAVSDYTYPGDPLRIDVAYQPNGVLHMLQALPLTTNIETAKALAFSYPQLAAGIAKKEKIASSLTAVVNDGLDRNHPQISFALGTLERSGIEVAGTAELPLIAERARRELMA